MARRKINESGVVYSATTDDAFVVDVRGIDYVSVACKSRDASWPASLVITLESSPDGGVNWYTSQYIDTTNGTGTNVTTFTANAIRRLVPVFDMELMRARVSTTNGTATIEVTVYGEGEEMADANPATKGKASRYLSIGAGSSMGGGSGSGGGAPSQGGSGSVGSGA